MRNWAVAAGMALIGLAVSLWVLAWPDHESSAVEESTPPAAVSEPAPVARTMSDSAPAMTTAMASPSTSTRADNAGGAPSLETERDDASPRVAARAQQRCEAQCDKDNGQCNSEARQSRQVCSRDAANGGNSPFSGRPESFDYYCGYFDIAQCGSRDCAARLAQRYAECVQVMRGDIISRRFDCIRAQDEAQSLCREELRDCRAQCE